MAVCVEFKNCANSDLTTSQLFDFVDNHSHGLFVGINFNRFECVIQILTYNLLFIELSCSEQALVKGKQSLVDLKDVIVSTLHEIFHDDVKLVGV